MNKLKLDISSNNENHESSINPLQYHMKSKLLLKNMRNSESDNFTLNKEKVKRNSENLVKKIKNNNLNFFQGPNDILDKEKYNQVME